MRRVALFVPDVYQGNAIFDVDDQVINQDDRAYPYFVLRERLRERGVELTTHDVHETEKYDAFLFLDVATDHEGLLQSLAARGVPRLVLLLEPRPVRPDNWDPRVHANYTCLLTWNDHWLRGDRYRKFCWPVRFPPLPESWDKERSEFCVVIAGNKESTDGGELYTERVRAIRWFERHQPDRLSLYGMGWDRGQLHPRHLDALKRSGLARRATRLAGRLGAGAALRAPFPSYRGKVARKHDVLARSRFSICYENSWNEPGWITEKIFDCFFAGCVPVYLGAPNVTDFIPQETFIDRREFRDYEALFRHLRDLPDARYRRMQEDIATFLRSPQARRFSAEAFAENVASVVATSLGAGYAP